MNLKVTNLLLPAFLFFAIQGNAQLYNNGAAIKIQSGAVIFVAGDVQNTNSGTISNDGKLEVQGSFTNDATYNSVAADDSLILSGGGNVTLKGGTAVINYLTIGKTANTNNVTLTGTTLLGKKLDYTSGNFTTDPVANPAFVFSAPVTAAFNFSAGREITGNVKRTGWANGAAVIFNQPGMLVKTNSGTSPADFTVTMIPGGDPTQAEREVKRKFRFAQTGGTGFTADISFAYQDAERNTNNEATLVPWELSASEWNGKLTAVTRDASANYVATTGISAAALTNEWKLADARYTFNLTAYLRGPWNSGTGLMNTSINSIIPNAQPYNITPFNYPGTENTAVPNANVTDWVLVELRKPASGQPEDALSSTIIGRKAGFMLNNGSVVDLDGVTPINFDISKQGPSFIVVRHRNHLGVLSNIIPSNALGTFANNFSVLANTYKPITGTSSDPVVLLPGASGKYGLWAGDANKNGSVNGTDVSAITLAISNSATGYLFTDTNMSNSINGTDASVSQQTISSSGAGTTPAFTATQPNAKKITTNIPDPIVE